LHFPLFRKGRKEFSMMRPRYFSFLTTSAFVLILVLLSFTPNHSDAQRIRMSDLDQEQLKAQFMPAKELLLQKNVPFDPEALLRSNWKAAIQGQLSNMPEMQETRVLGSRLSGAQLGDTLYLPERVQITGDTIILANNVIFEGQNPVIKGPHNIYFFPIHREGVIGTTLAAAMQKRSGLLRVKFEGQDPSYRPPRMLDGDWSLTIDASGLGYDDWLERERVRNGEAPSGGVLFEPEGNDSDGAPGTQGPDGANGANGSPDPASGGPPGSCSHPDGSNGEDGQNGEYGLWPLADGGIGGDGTNGSAIFTSVNATTGTYNFYARGGNGGPGGKGGSGGTGGNGATGGNGGNGADCACPQGGAGNGGNGGNGGKGGKGGDGGKGGAAGHPGNGNDIYVNIPSNFMGTINAYTEGGHGGVGGAPGDAGLAGLQGYPGNGGAKATTLNCNSSDPHNGSSGSFLGNFGNGFSGSSGQDRQGEHGQNGHFYPNYLGPLAGCNGPTDYPGHPSTGCASGLVDHGGICEKGYSFQSSCADPSGYDQWSCTCPDGYNPSPIVVDTDGNGFLLTDAAGGVSFDIMATGKPLQIAWTAPTSTNGLLVLDRNANGTIDSGTELFGNFAPQPELPKPNGFKALAEFDKLVNGGNGDGLISNADTIFASLRLWQDTNHNGVSEPSELHSLSSLGVRSIDLDYKESRRTDEFGNQFRYRSKLKDTRGAQLDRWAWDVFLVTSH
jgi:hypothetical protein